MKKNAQIANFNVVFGDEEKPMLDYLTRLFILLLTPISLKNQMIMNLCLKILK